MGYHGIQCKVPNTIGVHSRILSSSIGTAASVSQKSRAVSIVTDYEQPRKWIFSYPSAWRIIS